jgi:hypothetical protein
MSHATETPTPSLNGHRAPAGTSLRNLDLKAITGKLSGRATFAFYGVVLTVALIGSGTAAMHWLEWPWVLPAAVATVAAFVAVGVVEFGGVVLSMHADERRKLGERAVAARLLSAGFAATAVAVNWFGHDHEGMRAFFAGVSLFGYLVYLIISAAKRRDYLRAAGDLDDPTPVYGLAQWVRHPDLTRRARALAQANSAQRRAEVDGQPKGARPSTQPLGRLGSLAAARAEVRAERRHAAIAEALRRQITESRDPVAAEIAVQTYDLEEIAQLVAAAADYEAFAEIISADLTPARVAPPAREVPPWRQSLLPADVPAGAAADVPPADGADVPAAAGAGSSARHPAGSPGRKSTGTRRRKSRPEPRPRRSAEETRKLAAECIAAEPSLTQTELASRLGISDRQLRNVLNPSTPAPPKETPS